MEDAQYAKKYAKKSSDYNTAQATIIKTQKDLADFNLKLTDAKATIKSDKASVETFKKDFETKEKTATDQESKVKTADPTAKVEAWTPQTGGTPLRPGETRPTTSSQGGNGGGSSPPK